MKDNWFRQRSLFTPPPRAERPPSKKWRIGPVLWTALKRTCMFIGAFFLLTAFLSGFFSAAMIGKTAKPAVLTDKTVLQWTIDDDLVEHPGIGGYGFGGKRQTIRQIVDALDAAAQDKRIDGIMAYVKGGVHNLAHLQELHDAVKRFRENGKFAYIYADSYADIGGGLGLYYLAAAFDEIWMQPMGVLSIPGIRIEMPYARAALDRIGVTPQFFTRKEYKSVFENFAATEMSPAARENTTDLINNIAAHMTGEIEKDRDMAKNALKPLIDKALFLDEEAKAAGLIDQLGYFDMIDAKIREKVSGDPKSEDVSFFDMEDFIKTVKTERKTQIAGKTMPKAALIYVAGTIMPDAENEAGALSSAADIADNIDDAAEMDDIKAIIVRIDSPGGSPVAAETIRRALVKAKEKGKKLVVSMGNMAASGGYWIATDADYIFASPLTLTGSIGVAGGKFVMDGVWDKLSINWDAVQWGDNADIWSYNNLYTPQGEARMNAMMDSVYDGFIKRVAEGRGMSIAEADKIARGRVWTGAEAKGNGLVDELGGLDAALDYTAKQIGAADRHGMKIAIMPKPKTPLEVLAAFLEEQAGIGTFFRIQSQMAGLFSPFLEEIHAQNESGIIKVRAAEVRVH